MRMYAHLVQKSGLDKSHFDAAAENLAAALEDVTVPADLIKEGMASLSPFRELFPSPDARPSKPDESSGGLEVSSPVPKPAAVSAAVVAYEPVLKPPEHVLRTWRSADAVCFDVDCECAMRAHTCAYACVSYACALCWSVFEFVLSVDCCCMVLMRIRLRGRARWDGTESDL